MAKYEIDLINREIVFEPEFIEAAKNPKNKEAKEYAELLANFSMLSFRQKRNASEKTKQSMSIDKPFIINYVKEHGTEEQIAKYTALTAKKKKKEEKVINFFKLKKMFIDEFMPELKKQAEEAETTAEE